MGDIRDVPLGFSDATVPVGTHLCLMYSSVHEYHNLIQQFILAGLHNRERVACFLDGIATEEIQTLCHEARLEYNALKTQGLLTVEKAKESYGDHGKFDPFRLLNKITELYQSTDAMEVQAVRLVGEMSADVLSLPGGDRLAEYEARVNMRLLEVPVTTLCLYKTRDFPQETLMDVLKAHPHLLMYEQVVQNPYYASPQKILSRD